MPESLRHVVRDARFLGLVALALLLSVAMDLRRPDIGQPVGIANREATYHVLLTVAALAASPMANHWFLPTVSLGRTADKHISWGATRPGPHGDQIYTSFTPLGFLAPYAAFSLTGVAPTTGNLALFNIALGSLCAFALYFLIVRLLACEGYGNGVAAAAGLAASAIAIFSREALVSFGIVYWSHSLYQLVFTLCLICVHGFLSAKNATTRRVWAWALLASAFTGALTEWTGYLFNAGLIMVLLDDRRDSTTARGLALGLGAASVAAAALTILHFGLVIGFEATVTTMAERFFARNTAIGGMAALMRRYWLSFGFFALVVPALFILLGSLLTWRRLKGGAGFRFARSPATLPVLAVACLPLLENVVLLQHAIQFSYDRLKFTLPAALLFALAFSRFTPSARAVFGIVMIVASIHGYASYRTELERDSAWRLADISNRSIASQVANSVDVECAVFASNLLVRGYANLLFNRGIHELMVPREAAILMARQGACASIYLEGSGGDLPRYVKATIVRPDGLVTVITADE